MNNFINERSAAFLADKVRYFGVKGVDVQYDPRSGYYVKGQAEGKAVYFYCPRDVHQFCNGRQQQPQPEPTFNRAIGWGFDYSYGLTPGAALATYGGR